MHITEKLNIHIVRQTDFEIKGIYPHQKRLYFQHGANTNGVVRALRRLGSGSKGPSHIGKRRTASASDFRFSLA
jgi:hypothetical protein